MAGEGRTLPSFFIDNLLQRDDGKALQPEVDDAQARPDEGPDTDDAPPEAADVSPEAAVGFHLSNDGRPPVRTTSSATSDNVLGYQGDQGVLESCYHDNLCPDFTLPTPRTSTTLGCYSAGSDADNLRCQGNDRRQEGILEESSPIHIHDEPKPEVSDLSGAVDDGKKRPRTAFSADQVRSLEQEFQRSKYLSVSKRTEMSRQLGLTEQQIKIWFQNRRTKWKRKYTNNLEILAQQHYLRMGLLPAYPLPHPAGGGAAPKPPNAPQFVFGPPTGGLGGVRNPFASPQSAVRLYPPFAPGPSLPRM